MILAPFQKTEIIVLPHEQFVKLFPISDDIVPLKKLIEDRPPKHHVKKKTHPFGWVFLVDDIGLEPMTFRTSSGCSSQLS